MASRQTRLLLARLPLPMPRGCRGMADAAKSSKAPPPPPASKSSGAAAKASSPRPPVTFWPPLPGVPGMGPLPASAAVAAEVKLKPGNGMSVWLVTILGLPVVIGWYVYESYLQFQHDNKIDDVYRDLRSMLIKSHHRNRAPVAPADAPAPAPAPKEEAQPEAPAAPAAEPEAAAEAEPAAAAPVAAEQAVEEAPAAAEAAEAAAPAPAALEAAAADVVIEVVAKQEEEEQAAAAAATEVAQEAAAAAAPEAAAEPLQQEAAAAPAAEGAAAAPAAEEAAAPAPEAAAPADPSKQILTPELVAAIIAGHTPVLSSGDEPVTGPVPKGTLGVELDLSPAGLIRFAIERGQGPGEDWASFLSRHKQAVADAELFARALEQAIAYNNEAVAKVRAEADAHANRAAQVLALAQQNAEAFKRLLKQHQEMAAELRDLEVRQAEKRVALAASEAASEERKGRIAALDEIRVKLGALDAAHEARANQQDTSHAAHATSLGILGLQSALETGAPLTPHLGALAAGAPGDVLVGAAVSSIPASSAASGIPTRPALESRFRTTLRTAVSELSYFNGAGAKTGIISLAVAKLARWLKADETHAVRTLGVSAPQQQAAEGARATGIDAVLASVELLLAAGKLAEAAAVLETAVTGTAAGAVAADWLRDVKARAAADQALRVLRARATTLAASLA